MPGKRVTCHHSSPQCADCRRLRSNARAKIWHANNAARARANRQEWRRRNPSKVSEHRRAYKKSEAGRAAAMRHQSKTQLFPAHARLLELAQGGACAVCREQMSQACLDHDHTTGVIRGWLCHSCNRGLGLLQDSPEILERAAAYIRRCAEQARRFKRTA